MNKQEFRNEIIKKLNSANIFKQNYSSLYTKLFELDEFKNASTIAVTLNSKIEIDTFPIIEKCWKSGKQVVVPKTLSNHKMQFYLYNENTKLIKSKFGILEPVTAPIIYKQNIDLIVVPGLCFDKLSNNRLGFGGGYYDRYLADYEGFTVALATSYQLVETPKWVVNQFDIKINKIIY